MLRLYPNTGFTSFCNLSLVELWRAVFLSFEWLQTLLSLLIGCTGNCLGQFLFMIFGCLMSVRFLLFGG